jgi:hypothetical protein
MLTEHRVTDQGTTSLDIAILELQARVIGPPEVIGALRSLFPVPPPWTVSRGAEIADAEDVPVFAVTRLADGSAVVHIEGHGGARAHRGRVKALVFRPDGSAAPARASRSEPSCWPPSNGRSPAPALTSCRPCLSVVC